MILGWYSRFSDCTKERRRSRSSSICSREVPNLQTMGIACVGVSHGLSLRGRGGGGYLCEAAGTTHVKYEESVEEGVWRLDDVAFEFFEFGVH